MSVLNSLTTKEKKVWFKIAYVTETMTNIMNGEITHEERERLRELKDSLYEALDILEDNQ